MAYQKIPPANTTPPIIHGVKRHSGIATLLLALTFLEYDCCLERTKAVPEIKPIIKLMKGSPFTPVVMPYTSLKTTG